MSGKHIIPINGTLELNLIFFFKKIIRVCKEVIFINQKCLFVFTSAEFAVLGWCYALNVGSPLGVLVMEVLQNGNDKIPPFIKQLCCFTHFIIVSLFAALQTFAVEHIIFSWMDWYSITIRWRVTRLYLTSFQCLEMQHV